MGTANPKTTIDTQPNTTIKMVIKPQEKRTREEGKKKDLEKQTQREEIWGYMYMYS